MTLSIIFGLRVKRSFANRSSSERNNQAMLKGTRLQTPLVVSMLLLLPYGASFGRPRRRFCENYPFAPRCLGVAAKRSLEYDVSNRASPLDLYSTLVKRVLEEAKRQKPSIPTGEHPIVFDENSLFDKLASLVDKSQNDPFDTDAYTDGSDNWNSRFNDNERGI